MDFGLRRSDSVASATNVSLGSGSEQQQQQQQPQQAPRPTTPKSMASLFAPPSQQKSPSPS